MPRTLRRSARRPATAQHARSGGRTWWAHFEFTRINIEPIILKNKIEEQLIVGRVLPPDHPLPSLRVSTRSSIGVRRPREGAVHPPSESGR